MDYMFHYVEILYTNNTRALMAYLKYIWKLIKDKMKHLEHVVWLHQFCMQTLYTSSI